METEKSFEEYKNEIIKMYEKHYLEPSLGNGSIKDNLLEGLVESFDSVNIKYNLDTNEENFKQSQEYKFLTNPIKDLPISTRSRNRLLGANIESLADLVKQIYENGFLDSNHGSIRNKPNEFKYGAFMFKVMRNFGKKSRDEVINYLKENNFDFSKEYAEKVNRIYFGGKTNEL